MLRSSVPSAAEDPCVLMHLQKVLGESAAVLMQGLADVMAKRLVAVAAVNGYCPPRYCVLVLHWVTPARLFQSLSQLGYLCVVNTVQRQASISRIAENQAPRCRWKPDAVTQADLRGFSPL